MTTSTTVRSWPAIGLGAFFALVTGYTLFSDVIGGAAINTGHVLALAALVAAIASGHMAWPTLKAGKVIPAIMLAILFLGSTGYVVISSGARNAETAGTKAATADDINRQRAAIERMVREANIILGNCTAETAKQFHGIRCGLRDAMVKECATGKGKACDGKSYSVTTYEAALDGYAKQIAKLGPTTAPNGGYAHAARVIGAITFATDVDAIEARLILILPFLTVLISELGCITFLHLGLGHRGAEPKAPATAEPAAPKKPAPTRPRGKRGPKRDDKVVQFVTEFRKRNGRNPTIPEMQASLNGIARSTAHRYATAA